jgi:hypothetical protein
MYCLSKIIYTQRYLILTRLKEGFIMSWYLFNLIPLPIRIFILIRFGVFSYDLLYDPVVNMSSEFLRSITNGIYDSPSPEPSSPGGGGNGGGNNGVGSIVVDGNTPLTAQQKEANRIILYNKLNQLTVDFHGPNKGKTMNSANLINLVFTHQDRQTMFTQLTDHHPEAFRTNQFGYTIKHGFSCKIRISKEVLALFSDVNR